MLELSNALSPRSFREIIAAGAARSVEVRADARGLYLVLNLGMVEHVLGTARGGVRYFQSLDGAASILWQHGIREFKCDTSNWQPKTLKKAIKEEGVE